MNKIYTIDPRLIGLFSGVAITAAAGGASALIARRLRSSAPKLEPLPPEKPGFRLPIGSKKEKSIFDAGFAYNPKQDIFYSVRDPWQRKFGYCHLYDIAAPSMSMVIDCEPIEFNFEGKRWLIEFWKGQYGMTTGGEVGVYTTTDPEISIPEVFTGNFYRAAVAEDNLPISFKLYKNGKELFKREDRHWWLTGFVLGLYSEPEELAMTIRINLKNAAMRRAFVQAMVNAGYGRHELSILGNTVNIVYQKPHALQPRLKEPLLVEIACSRNQVNCQAYEDTIAELGLTDSKARIEYLRRYAPEVYNNFVDDGRWTRKRDDWKTIVKNGGA